jgi:hypothetical protein
MMRYFAASLVLVCLGEARSEGAHADAPALEAQLLLQRCTAVAVCSYLFAVTRPPPATLTVSASL